MAGTRATPPTAATPPRAPPPGSRAPGRASKRCAAGAALTWRPSAWPACSPPSRSPARPARPSAPLVVALLLLALAAAVWPWLWSERGVDPPRAREHLARAQKRRRPARRVGPLCRLGGRQGGERRAQPVRCAPARPQLAGAPSPYSRRPPRANRRRGHHGGDRRHGSAASHGRRPRLQAERRYHQRQIDAERREHQSRLDAIERDAQAAIEAGEQQVRRELAAQEAAERRAQADAVARALRRS